MKPRGPCRLWARLMGWLVLIWTASVAALAIAALSVPMLVNLAGMTT